jgi:hypothetical protein
VGSGGLTTEKGWLRSMLGDFDEYNRDPYDVALDLLVVTDDADIDQLVRLARDVKAALRCQGAMWN